MGEDQKVNLKTKKIMKCPKNPNKEQHSKLLKLLLLLSDLHKDLDNLEGSCPKEFQKIPKQNPKSKGKDSKFQSKSKSTSTKSLK
ncbi:unnamed protein product (macronuclear) [Paramecium tetraurelia]|uniref:Uncharacterized protein n=1 Tax=Paramecium tetraurelia TaxID=5888 RepID=A0BKL6_PARTE|nr:uncharacterized protein GSPATT00029714001 [Paramecium tetraurelia]CAK59083.1 unnamed protein product [Paramecium tetraurelia]|eukprot:XP_001426481.1 hypothetical protein (macronuclear) [Paramecium tetraurelia strain d4-2]